MTFEPATVRLAENEGDAKLSTWDKLFGALGHILEFDTTESCEDIGGLILDETHRRMENRYQGLMSRLGRR